MTLPRNSFRELCYLLEQKIITIVDDTLTRENFECLLADLPILKLRKTSRNGAPTGFMSRILSDSEMDFDLHGAVAMKFLRIQGLENAIHRVVGTSSALQHAIGFKAMHGSTFGQTKIEFVLRT